MIRSGHGPLDSPFPDIWPAGHQRLAPLQFAADSKTPRNANHRTFSSHAIAAASIFKAYDIRGVVPATFNEPWPQALGRAFGTVALREGQTTLAVGRDGRLSGALLSAALIRGLLWKWGWSVIDVGMVTTPMLYFAASTLCASGIQVTGSHNPKDYNGFKMVMAGRAIYGDEIQALRQHDGRQKPVDPAAGRRHATTCGGCTA
jgi:phosphomannomutase